MNIETCPHGARSAVSSAVIAFLPKRNATVPLQYGIEHSFKENIHSDILHRSFSRGRIKKSCLSYSFSSPTNCCLQYCCAQRLAFPFGEGAPVRTLGRKRFSQRHDDKHIGIYGKTPKRWFLPTAKRIFTLYQTSSVTQIGSEVPIWVPASPKGKPRALPRQCCKHQFIHLLRPGRQA